jgi:dienelactone hydrolase
MIEKKVAYEHDGRKFEGAIVYDDSVKTKRPVLFMQPDWNGVSVHTLEQARDIAGKDYVVLMADMFGEGYGARQKTVDDLMKSSRGVRGNVPFINACGAKALQVLGAEAEKLGVVDPAKKFAVGYCIGGGYVLEQARAGADFKGVVVFHVTAPNPVVPNTPCNIKGRVLAIHGAADPVTPKPQMDALEAELTAAKVDWQEVLFGHAVHSFCDPSAPATGNQPQRYDAKLCQKSYQLMREFFAEMA